MTDFVVNDIVTDGRLVTRLRDEDVTRVAVIESGSHFSSTSNQTRVLIGHDLDVEAVLGELANHRSSSRLRHWEHLGGRDVLTVHPLLPVLGIGVDEVADFHDRYHFATGTVIGFHAMSALEELSVHNEDGVELKGRVTLKHLEVLVHRCFTWLTVVTGVDLLGRKLSSHDLGLIVQTEEVVKDVVRFPRTL